ncbi:tripartite tricarboxylate transporter TctB family protein [Acuticoccus sp.]|uniref:tripartite tricarboxylate transporter TctB family protein n=1 Tax=Acuticoccus sp. TaxID=1904378 RepID=UPI003B51686B
MTRSSYLAVGLAAIGLAAFLFLVGIPYGITTPSNVRHLVLSPLFWPMILAGLLAVCGLALVAASRGVPAGEVSTGDGPRGGGVARLAAAAVLMTLYVALMPWLGLVWTSMAAFILVAALVRTRHRVAAAIGAVAIPLALYAFFAHVAGVAIPQGELVRLP